MNRTTDLNKDIKAWMSAFFQPSFINACERFVDRFRREGIRDLMAYHSGGGCCHLFVVDDDGYVHTIHNEESQYNDDGSIGYQCETSYLQWDNADEYALDNEEGFGWEYIHPNYDDRTYLFNPKTSEFKYNQHEQRI